MGDLFSANRFLLVSEGEGHRGSVGGTDPISWDLQFPTLVGVDLAGARSPYVSVLMGR